MINSSNPSLGFCFFIETPVEVTAVPRKRSIVNEFDLIGDMVSLKRIDGESNASYRQRIADVSVHPGGPTYEGVLNNLIRELGIPRGKTLSIDLKRGSGGEIIATSPCVKMYSNKIILYETWNPFGSSIPDKEIRFYQKDDEGYFLLDLVNEINSSSCYEATIDPEVRPNLHSCNLILSSSDRSIYRELVPSENKFSLVAKNIQLGSVLFDEKTIFNKEVSVTPAASGEFTINYEEGEIEVFDLPIGSGGVSYKFQVLPLQINYSMIRLYSLQDEYFKSELFNHETLDSGEEVNTLPNTEGSEVFHQLYTQSKIFWGK